MPYSREGLHVSMGGALDAWEPVAIAKTIQIAGKYGATIKYGELRDVVFAETGIRHDGLLPNWIGQLLNRLIRYCNEQDIPQLSALVVREDGSVGDGYIASLTPREKLEFGRSLDDLDDHASRVRLSLYRYFGADLPPGGGEAMLTRQVREARDRRNCSTPKRDMGVCPTHNTVLPSTGRCDYCQ